MNDTNTLPPGWVLQPGTLAYQEAINTQSRAHGNVGKPIRRRSRASRRTPTTLVNATTTNFRALVQQFTGSTHKAKAPLNLSFALGSDQNQLGGAISRVSPLGYHYHQQHQHHHHHHHQQQQQQQQSFFSLSTNTTSVPKPNVQATSDDFAIANVSLQELVEESSINRSTDSGYIFRHH
ncbi:hypothetical protein RJ639_038057 [Escallonia herrerae]|uniref:VQ domain-containing protein n=1 Tax=Escallonia herrerae TaxID=1293975 RepID=A0AA88WJR1_9ASTE|nr:hypothetical protein RJ639_038057 [Escallonia herrerae]